SERSERSMTALRDSMDGKIEHLRETVDAKLTNIQRSNETKLTEMRETVDEKLSKTLETRLNASFEQVSNRLEAVYKGLGEMQSLASGVGDLKKILTNVKTRGTWGEIQLGNLLEQMLTPSQYQENVAVIPNSLDRVEYAVVLPGKDGERPVYLPIDSKFPVEDYARLVSAQEAGDAEAVETAHKELVRAVKTQAKKIAEKYIMPPYTTDFAIMFLPTEGLFAEVLRADGLVEELQRVSRVAVTGPTTLSSVLTSLQMGFKTLAIEKRSSEVWELLGAIKTEFGKFADVLEKTQSKLDLANKEIENAKVRTRAIQRKLRGVEELPEEESRARLGNMDFEEYE
ncbi:MAG: DNA recombination protein RmuC, partial [Clostridia bacterium]|nr:DNA recombination protein RmuC [Clostridia bacterium]